jgi:hypothetical protein
VTKDDLIHAAIVSGIVDEAAVHDAESYDSGGTLAKLDAMFAALQGEPTRDAQDAREDRAYYNGARQAAAMAHQSLDAMDDWIESGCGGRGPSVLAATPVTYQSGVTYYVCPHHDYKAMRTEPCDECTSENRPAEPPPVDNDHVAEGCEKFGDRNDRS